jgi:hypothetical protein
MIDPRISVHPVIPGVDSNAKDPVLLCQKNGLVPTVCTDIQKFFAGRKPHLPGHKFSKFQTSGAAGVRIDGIVIGIFIRSPVLECSRIVLSPFNLPSTPVLYKARNHEQVNGTHVPE